MSKNKKGPKKGKQGHEQPEKEGTSQASPLRWPSFFDASILLASLTAVAYISAYFSLLSKYRIANIPKEFIDVSLNDVIHLGSILYMLVFGLIYVSCLLYPFNKTATRKGLFVTRITYHSVPQCFLIIAYVYFPITPYTYMILVVVTLIILMLLDLFIGITSKLSALVMKYVGGPFLLVQFLLVAPIVATSFNVVYIFNQREFVEIIPKNTNLESSYTIENGIKKGMTITKVTTKDAVSTKDASEILRQLNEDEKLLSYAKRQIILGQYGDKFIVRTLKIYKNSNRIEYTPTIELIPRGSEYDLSVIRLPSQLPMSGS
ncbi:hypothetical protein POF51_29730 [Brevibacillus sp. AG]|uniref:hypothetical protein n=1 Tax=Brevibacillus sp. AG TaxID=3020891 RepID=UPI0023305086|nr:hypothetical protein [Brevibacillus sp. AG]MDC0764905.1 hypothetical protein [Brevibacillus sp. AG]